MTALDIPAGDTAARTLRLGPSDRTGIDNDPVFLASPGGRDNAAIAKRDPADRRAGDLVPPAPVSLQSGIAALTYLWLSATYQTGMADVLLTM